MNTTPRLQILIVEDDDDGRDNFVDLLEMDHHQVKPASSGRQALQLCEEHCFDAVVLDWNLLDATADRLIPHISKLQPNKPIIVVTGYGDVNLVVSAMRTGVWDYLEKPINLEVLRATLSRVEERKANMETLERVQEKLVASERLAAIGQMVAGLAHESRNAFQRSQACLEMLELNLEGDDENIPIVGKIQNALEQLHKLYEEVRDYAAPIILEKCPTNLYSLINETWQEILLTNPNINSRFIIDCTSTLESSTFPLDRRRLQQVFRNILENAVDANSSQSKQRVEGSPEQTTVVVKIQEDDKNLDVYVADSGGGICRENNSDIFEPFVTTKTRGTGLGLAITKRIIEAHQGLISVENSDVGSIFHVSVPKIGQKTSHNV